MSPVRLLRSADLDRAIHLSTEAGWNQTQEDWQMLLALAPEGCFGIEEDGTLVATTTLLAYGGKLGWIGMVLTDASFRRRGLARRLVTHALERADTVGIDTVKLDATEQAQPLYEELGFRAEQPVERWVRAGDRGMLKAGSELPGDVFEMDAAAYGADRGPLLRALAARSQALPGAGAYALCRAGSLASYIGPIIGDACRSLEIGPGCWYWDLLPRNRPAVAMAGALGFAPERHLLRMVRGRELRGKEEMIFAIAGFELG